jgi:hypothetical protein
MNRLGHKVTVPPLDDARLARIERAVLAESAEAMATARSWRWQPGWLVPAAALAMAALAIVALRGTERPMPIALHAPAPVVVATAAGEHARLELGDAVVELGESTRVSIDRRADDAVLLALDRGTIACEVEPRVGRAPFEVLADDVRVTVIGTAFAVTSSPDSIAVAVTHGMVAVTRAGAPATTVSAGQSWNNQIGPRGSIPGGHQLRESSPGHQLRESSPRGHPPGESIPGDPTPNPRRESIPGGHPNQRRESSSGGDPLRESIPGGHPNQPPRITMKRAPGQSENPLPGTARAPRFSSPASADLAAITAIEASNPREAARRFGAVALRDKGATASFALYSQLYLLAYPLAERGAALEAARLYERRFPRGREAESVAWIRIGLLCAADRIEDCRAAAHGYLARYPRGGFRAEAARITNR